MSGTLGACRRRLRSPLSGHPERLHRRFELSSHSHAVDKHIAQGETRGDEPLGAEFARNHQTAERKFKDDGRLAVEGSDLAGARLPHPLSILGRRRTSRWREIDAVGQRWWVR